MLEIALWSMISTRAVIGLLAFALCLTLIRRLRREKFAREILGENGMQAEILEGELRGLFSESKWLAAMALTASLRVGYALTRWWHGVPQPRLWDYGDVIGSSIVLAFTVHSAWVVWSKRKERSKLYQLAREERNRKVLR